MSKHKKTFTVFGLLAAVAILTGAIFVLSQPPKHSDIDGLADEAAGSVAVGGIDGDATGDAAAEGPAIDPGPITAPEPMASGQSNSDIPLTVIEDKPEPPELPDTAPTDGPHEPPADPALTNPNEKPDAAPRPVETAPPTEQAPSAGGGQDGQIYIPGFGWVEDEGGGGQGEISVGEGSLDKIIGY